MDLTLLPPKAPGQAPRQRLFAWLRCLAVDPRLYAWLGILVAIACVFKAVPSRPTFMWVSSDTLWPVHLFIDVFRDGYSLRGWEFSIAPCWCPDIAIVGVCYLLLRNPLLTTFAAGAVQYVVLLAGFCLCWRALGLTHRKLVDTLTLATGVAVALWVAAHTDVLYPGLYQLLLPQTHVGNLIMHVYAVWLALLVIGGPTGRRRTIAAVGFAAVCFLAAQSNVMFFPHTLVPLSLGLLALTLTRALLWQQAGLLIITGWPAAVAGAVAYRMFFSAMSLGAQSTIGPAAWRTAIRTFSAGVAAAFARLDLQHIVASLWLGACLAVCGVVLWRLRGASHLHSENRGALIVLFFGVSAGGAVFGPITMIAGGSNGLTQFNDYMWTMHYMHPTFLLPLFAWPSLIGLLPPIRLSRWAVQGAAAAGAATCLGMPLVAFERIPAPLLSVSEYAPDFVRALDQEAGQYHIKYGIAGYWQARLITLLSRTGLRVYPVDGSLHPFLIVSNREWYAKSLEDRSKAPCFSFAVLNDPLWKLARATVVGQAGAPSYELNAANVPVLVYANRARGQASARCASFLPSTAGFEAASVGMNRRLSHFASSLTSSVPILRVKPWEKITIPVRIGNPTSEAWSSTGKFPVTLGYKWIRNGKMLPFEGQRALLRDVLEPGATVEVSAVAVAPQEPGEYTLRLSLVQEAVTWFVTAGAAPLDIPTTVVSAAAAQPR